MRGIYKGKFILDACTSKKFCFVWRNVHALQAEVKPNFWYRLYLSKVKENSFGICLKSTQIKNEKYILPSKSQVYNLLNILCSGFELNMLLCNHWVDGRSRKSRCVPECVYKMTSLTTYIQIYILNIIASMKSKIL